MSTGEQSTKASGGGLTRTDEVTSSRGGAYDELPAACLVLVCRWGADRLRGDRYPEHRLALDLAWADPRCGRRDPLGRSGTLGGVARWRTGAAGLSAQ